MKISINLLGKDLLVKPMQVLSTIKIIEILWKYKES